MIEHTAAATADKVKRRKTRELIEQELYTYQQTRAQIKQRIAEIDNIASPRSNWPPIGRVSGEKGDVVAFVEGGNGRDRGQHSDPTPDRAQKVSDYKEKVLGGKVFREMVERAGAIERVLDRWRADRASGLPDRRLAACIVLHIVQRKYFERADDEAIWKELGISRASFYRYRAAILQAIADELGWVV